MSPTCGLEWVGGETELEVKMFIYDWENRIRFTRLDFVKLCHCNV